MAMSRDYAVAEETVAMAVDNGVAAVAPASSGADAPASGGATELAASNVANVDMKAAGMEVYSILLSAALNELGVHHSGGALDVEHQLQAYGHAARFFEHRDAVFAALQGEASAASGLEAYAMKAVEASLKELEARGNWASLSKELKSKRVFGHKAVIKFIKLPNVPQAAQAASVYLREEEGEASSTVSFGGGLRFRGEQHPLDYLEQAGLALVLALDDVEKGARVVIAPGLLQEDLPAGEADSDESLTRLQKFLIREAAGWKHFLQEDGQKMLRSDASLQTLQGVLEASQKLSKAPLAQKRKLQDGEDAADNGEEDAVEVPAGKEHSDAGQRGYGALLGALFEELGFYSDAENGWLEVRKELLIYHHAAALAEHRDMVIAALKHGAAEGSAAEGAEALPPAHNRAIASVREKVLADLTATGQKVKKIFGHEHVIQFHKPPKGLPVPRSCCVYIRERPQVTSDYLRKTPSVFRDVVRFKCQGNALTVLEEHGVALVFTVEKSSPKAFLVISPLLEQPDLIAEAAGKTWPEIKEMLKDHLVNFITKDAEAWRTFVQRHAHVIGKESLRLILKVLKNYKPSPEQVLKDAELLEQAKVSRVHEHLEVLAMSRAEAEGRCVIAESLARSNAAEAAGARKKAAAAEKAHLAAEQAHLAAEQAHQDLLAKAAKEANEAAEASAQALRDLSASAARDAAEAARESARAMEDKDDEAEALAELNQELLLRVHSLEKQTLHVRRQASIRLAKVPRLTHKLEEATEQLEAKEQQVQEAAYKEAALERERDGLQAEVTTARSHVREAKSKVAAAEKAVAEANRAEVQAKAECELKVQLVGEVTASNAALRLEAAERTEEAARAKARQVEAELAAVKAEQAAVAARAQEAQARESLEKLDKETRRQINELSKSCDELRGEVAAAVSGASAAEARASEARKAEVRNCAELQLKKEEVQRLTDSCVSLRGEVAKAEEQIAVAEDAAARARAAEATALAESQLKTETVSRLTAANVELRAQAADAAAKTTVALQHEADAMKKVADAEKAASAAREAQLQLQETLSTKEAEVGKLRLACDELQVQASSAAALTSVAEAAASEARQAEKRLGAELQLKNAEIERLTVSCATLRGDVAKAQEDIDEAFQRVVLAEQAASRARAAEAATQAELQLKAETVTRLTDSNVQLRAQATDSATKAAESIDREVAALKALAEAEDAAVTARDEARESRMSAQAKADEIKALSSSCDQLRTEAAAATSAAASAAAATAVAEAEASEARRAESRVGAELRLKNEEVQRLTDSCVSLRGDVAKATEQTEEVLRRAFAAEEAAAQARAAEAAARADLQLKTEVASRLSTANVELRAQAVDATTKAQDACEREVAALKIASDAQQETASSRAAEAEARAALRQHLDEAKTIDAACAKLREEVAGLAARLEAADERAAIADRAATEAKNAEVRVSAELRVQRAEALRLGAAVAQQAVACSRLQKEVDLASERAAIEKQLAGEVQARLDVAMSATELSTDEVELLARNGKKKAVALEPGVSPEQHYEETVEPVTAVDNDPPCVDINVEDLEKALLEETIEPVTAADNDPPCVDINVEDLEKALLEEATPMPADKHEAASPSPPKTVDDEAIKVPLSSGLQKRRLWTKARAAASAESHSKATATLAAATTTPPRRQHKRLSAKTSVRDLEGSSSPAAPPRPSSMVASRAGGRFGKRRHEPSGARSSPRKRLAAQTAAAAGKVRALPLPDANGGVDVD